MNEILIAGLVGVAVGMVEIIKVLVSRAKSNGKGCLTSEQHIWLRDLYDWHNKEDEDGVKMWYVRKSLVEAIQGLREATEKQTLLLELLTKQIASTVIKK